MSLMTQAYLLEKFGPRVDVPALAQLTGLSIGTVRNQISSGSFPIPTTIENGRRTAAYEKSGGAATTPR